MAKLIGMRSCSGFQDLKSGSIVVCHYAMGLSFLALILLAGRLYNVDRQVSLLSTISSLWFPDDILSPSPPDVANNGASQAEMSSAQNSNPQNGDSSVFASNIENLVNLKADIEYIIVELSSARITLILSVVFVVVYILSWWWMAFSINQAKEDGGVSLKTVLLLAVFAAVDIAASAGFVLLRIIMYVMRDRFYPWDMRTPSVITEPDSIAGHAALRLLTLQTSCGANDIMVAIIVGFLTGLRIYSVVCVYSYYKKAKNGAVDSFQKSVTEDSDYIADHVTRQDKLDRMEKSGRHDRANDIYEYLPRPYFGNRSTSRHFAEPFSNKPQDTTTSRQSRGRFSTTTVSTDEEEILNELKIQAADMPSDMQRKALESAAQAIKLYTTEKHIAESIKQDFDTLYNPTWHCIVGRNWGSCVTHSKQCYIRLAYRDMTLLLYRST
ncbi:uncharacterized protein LOC143245322 [Tachypleus tridentatus]|uniref:uncharacterized protein LOC143245322 n=1 Tax=Tachypleus tridentatus TaxID=6853 RepID=UPI003FD59D68